MTEETITTEQDTLGDVLRKTRLDRGLKIEQVANETRIAPHILRAMENDDFSSLPAPAFSRGFYGLYAKLLALDPDSIQLQYKNILKQTNTHQQQPQRLTGNVKNLAERPPIPVPSIISFALLLTFIVFAILAWFFQWNPANFLSRQLRNLDPAQQIELQVNPPTQLPEDNSKIVNTQTEVKTVGAIKYRYAHQQISRPSTKEINLPPHDDIALNLPLAKENSSISIPNVLQ